MPPCREPGCVGLADEIGGQCVPHRQGYRQHTKAVELRCSHCRRLFLKDEWYREIDNQMRHAKPCKEHPEIAKERAKAEARA